MADTELDQGHQVDARVVEMLSRDNRALKTAGDNLAVAGLLVATEYDGVHRLRLAVAAWAKAVADEGGRAERYAPATRALYPNPRTQERP